MRSTKSIFFLFIFCLLAAGCTSVQSKQTILQQAEIIRIQAQQNTEVEVVDVAAPEVVDNSFKLPEYERLVYKAKYLGMTVGVMTSSIEGIVELRGRKAYKCVTTAKTTGLFAKIFRVNDRFVSYMDAEHFHTLRHEVYREEGKYRKVAIIDFDQVNHKAYYHHLLKDKKEVIDIPENVQDPVTANYYFRLKPLALGNSVEFNVYVDEEVYNLFGIINKKTRLRMPKLGKKDVYVFQPYAVHNGEMVKKGKATGYFLAEPKYIPVKGVIKTPIFGGAASVQLVQAEYKDIES